MTETESEWLNEINYLYTSKQYKNRFILMVISYLFGGITAIVGFALAIHFSEETFKAVMFGMLMGFGSVLCLTAFSIITQSVPPKMNIYRFYKKNPEELNAKVNHELLAKAKCRVGNEVRKEKLKNQSFGNLILTGLGGSGGSAGTKKWRTWKAYQKLKAEKRFQDYR